MRRNVQLVTRLLRCALTGHLLLIFTSQWSSTLSCLDSVWPFYVLFGCRSNICRLWRHWLNQRLVSSLLLSPAHNLLLGRYLPLAVQLAQVTCLLEGLARQRCQLRNSLCGLGVNGLRPSYHVDWYVFVGNELLLQLGIVALVLVYVCEMA